MEIHMKNYDLVIFDVDGTLLDTTEGVLSAIDYAIKKHHLPGLSVEQLYTFIGPPIQKSLKAHYNLDDTAIQAVAETFRERYKDVDLLKATPYDGIYEVLDSLKKRGIQLAVATYKRHDYALDILKHFQFDTYTNILYGADNFNKLKKCDIIRKCISDANSENLSKILMIGDSDNDAVAALEAGVDFLGVTYGFGFKSQQDVETFNAIGSASTPLEILQYCSREE